jgi:endonuclease/exonuclease/phosphatase family metal-dependent hydrolase
VAFQEVFETGPGSSAPLMMEHLTGVCPFPYEVAYIKDNGVDDSLLLSRYPVVTTELTELLNAFRNAYHVRIDHPIGLVDVFSTHLAAGVDGGNNACGTGAPCPPECLGLTSPTVRHCQAEQVARYVEAEHDLATPALLLGDFNATPTTASYAVFTGRGWTDAYLAGGNPECVPATGAGCSSGREDANLSDLESPVPNVSARIDYAFVVPGSTCTGTLDTGSDADGDGVATRHFADEPNTFGAACGAAPAPICWPSDHNGVQLDLNCQ